MVSLTGQPIRLMWQSLIKYRVSEDKTWMTAKAKFRPTALISLHRLLLYGRSVKIKYCRCTFSSGSWHKRLQQRRVSELTSIDIHITKVGLFCTTSSGISLFSVVNEQVYTCVMQQCETWLSSWIWIASNNTVNVEVPSKTMHDKRVLCPVRRWGLHQLFENSWKE